MILDANITSYFLWFSGCNPLRGDFWTRVGWVKTWVCCLKFCFRARTVSYIKFSVDNGCLQPRFLISFQKTKVVSEWFSSSLQWTSHCFHTNCSTTDHPHNICYYVRKPGTRTGFWRQFATEWPFQKILLLANMKLNLDCYHGAVRTGSRRQHLISVMFGCLNPKFLMSIPWNRRFFRKPSCSSWCLIYVQVFSQLIFGLAHDFNLNLQLRSQDYNHFYFKLHEVRHFEKEFGFKVAWD